MCRLASRLGIAVLWLTLGPACAMRAQVDPQDAAERLQARTGVPARVAGVVPPEIPTGVRLDDGLTADEAVAIALWNNAAFQVSVSELGFARADLLDAGVLTNPVLSLLLPVGPKQLEATLRWPVEVLWERPRRIAMARLAADAAGHRLVQAGLDLVLAVRGAHADLSLAIDRHRLATETAGLLARIDTLTQSRLAAGDIGELDARAARVDTARAQQDAERAVHDAAIARDRLRLLLGLTAQTPSFEISASSAPSTCGPITDLLREALVARPDVRAAELGVQALTLVPKVEVTFRPERAQQVGVTSAAVRDAVATVLGGTKVGEIFDQQKVFAVVVWSTPARRQDLFSLRRLPIELPGGGYAPLESVADVTLAPTPNEITPEGGSRRIDVTSNIRGRDLGSVARDIETALAGISFDAGYHPEVLGEYKARAESQNRLLALGALSLLGILLVLHVDFGSVRLVALVALTIPFALIGVFLTGGVLSLGSLVGFVTVLGIAARNGIMLVSHYRHLEHEEGVSFGADLAMRGAEERLAPILMTALVTGLALVPIIAGGDRSGHEIEHPMAVVILGGLATSTVLNLFLLPAIYLRYGTRA